jgi:CRISPR/Cas system-associated endonuclease/helicase Cas3
MEFKEKVLLNARKFARRFSMAKGKNSETKQSVYEDIENNFRLVRSQSGKKIFFIQTSTFYGKHKSCLD